MEHWKFVPGRSEGSFISKPVEKLLLLGTTAATACMTNESFLNESSIHFLAMSMSRDGVSRG